MQKKLLITVIIVLAAIFGGTGALFGQEGTAADADISPNTITATSGMTTFTYRVTNTSGAAGLYFDQIRIYNPNGYTHMAVPLLRLSSE